MCLFNTYDEAKEAISRIIENNKRENYSAEFFAIQFNVSTNAIILKNETHTLTINNLLYLYCQKSNKFKYVKNEFGIFIKKVFKKNDDFINFSNPDMILKVLLTNDKPFEELKEICERLSFDIKELHKSEKGIEYPSQLTQCILECFKIKNNFLSSTWYSNKHLKDVTNSDLQPITFSRISSKGEMLNYALYNFDQIDETQEYKAIDLITDNNFETVSTQESPIDVTNKKIKTVILACIREFCGMYGRSGIAKILKGSSALKNNEYTKEAVNSNFFGLCKQLTFAFINAEIDELISEGIIISTKKHMGRPFLSVNPDIEIEKVELFNEISPDKALENDDENIVKILKLLKQGKNIFVTGHAGTGKSYILNKLKEKMKSLVVTSTTGIAAVNVKGQTLHSWAGVGICNKPISQAVENILKKASTRNQIQKCKILAIDEISMLNIETLEYVDLVFKKVRGVDKPFGGIQVIFIGDFFQLPPVNTKNEPIKYCFESSLWDDLDLYTILLTKNYRQNEENFIQALSNMRINSLSSEDINLLKTRESVEKKQETDILHIFATNYEADKHNHFKFNQLNAPEYKLFAIDGVYKGEKFVEEPTNERDTKILQRIDVVCSAEKSISLKIGAKVMLLINLDFEKCLINGSCGNVNEICDDFVLVRFDNGIEKKIGKHDFEFYNNDILIAMRKQFPLRLAYGITIHKSQGMSLDKLVVDCSRIFEKGQAYVAMSRVKTLEGLHLSSFSPDKVWVDEKVVKFYNDIC